MMCSPPETFCEDGNLYVRWKQAENNKESILFIAENNQYGKLFPVDIPQEFQTIFPKLKKTPPSEATHLLLCQNGDLFLVITQAMSNLIYLCCVDGSPIWCGIIKVSDHYFLAICDRNGSMYFGKKLTNRTTPDCFYWYLCDLQSQPVTLLKLDDHVVISDGNSSYCVALQFTGKEIKAEIKKLPYFGIVDIKLVANDVKLIACDGRTYIKSLADLLLCNVGRNTNRNYKNIMLPAIIHGLKINSDFLSDRGQKCDLLDRYLEQINIAKSLLIKCSNDICNVKLNLDISVEREHSLIIIVCIDITDAVKLDFKWWQIKASLSENHCEHSSIVCPMENNIGVVSLKIPFIVSIHSIERLLRGTVRLKLNIFLDFMHFISGRLVCCVNIREQNLDAHNFLTSDRLPVTCVSSQLHFNTVSNPPSTTLANDGKQIFKCSVSTDKSRLLHHCSFIKDINVCNGHLQLWFLRTPVNFIFKKQSQSAIETVIETTDNTLLIVIKYALQLRLCLGSSVIKLTDVLRREGHFCKRVIEVETSNTVDMAVMKRLHEIMTNYFSKVHIS